MILNMCMYLSKGASVLDNSKIRSLILSLSVMVSLVTSSQSFHYRMGNTSELGHREKSPTRRRRPRGEVARTGDPVHREISATSELGYEENSPKSNPLY